MRIAFLTQTFPFTPTDATAHFMYDFTRGFAELGHKVFVLLPFHPKLKSQSFLNIKLVPFRYIWPDFFHLLGFGNTLENDQALKWFVYLLTPFYFLFGSIALYKIVKKEKIEAVNAHWILPSGFMAAVVGKLTRKPVFITLAGSDVYLSKMNFIFKYMANFAIDSATKIVSNSPQLMKDLGVKGEVISYAVPKNNGKRIKNASLVVATAGRRVEKKGFEIVKKHYRDIEIISGLPIDKFRKKLLSVDIFIAYSIRDKKGNLDDASLTVLEAMAAGCAVIATDLPGYRKIIKNGYNGLLISPFNPEEIITAIESLKKSKKLQEKLGLAARDTISAYFTPNKIASLYMKLFARL